MGWRRAAFDHGVHHDYMNLTMATVKARNQRQRCGRALRARRRGGDRRDSRQHPRFAVKTLNPVQSEIGRSCFSYLAARAGAPRIGVALMPVGELASGVWRMSRITPMKLGVLTVRSANSPRLGLRELGRDAAGATRRPRSSGQHMLVSALEPEGVRGASGAAPDGVRLARPLDRRTEPGCVRCPLCPETRRIGWFRTWRCPRPS